MFLDSLEYDISHDEKRQERKVNERKEDRPSKRGKESHWKSLAFNS